LGYSIANDPDGRNHPEFEVQLTCACVLAC
jgi:hypothetical protein